MDRQGGGGGGFRGLLTCLVLSREWGNGSYSSPEIIPKSSPNNPLPHSLRIETACEGCSTFDLDPVWGKASCLRRCSEVREYLDCGKPVF